MHHELCAEIQELWQGIAQFNLVAQRGGPPILHIAILVDGIDWRIVTLIAGAEYEFVGYEVCDTVESCVHMKLNLCVMAILRQVIRMPEALRWLDAWRFLGPRGYQQHEVSVEQQCLHYIEVEYSDLCGLEQRVVVQGHIFQEFVSAKFAEGTSLDPFEQCLLFLNCAILVRLCLELYLEICDNL